MWKIRHGSLNKHPKLSLTGNVPRLIVIQDTLHWLHKFSLLIESELLRDRCCSLWSRRPESALDACCADALPPCSLCRQADESCAVSGAGDARDWWGPGGNEVWMWKSVGPTAPWPRADGRRSGGTPTPLRTTRSVGCPRRSPTAPARLWRPMTTTAGCTTETGSRTSSTGSQMSFQDKVRGAAPLTHCLMFLTCAVACCWGPRLVEVRAKYGAIEGPISLVEENSPFYPAGIPEVLLWSRTPPSFMIWRLVLETHPGGFWQM